MATAKLIPPTPALPHVELVLTMQEAQLIRELVGSVTGDEEGPRGASDRIFRALTCLARFPRLKMDLEPIALPDTWPDQN